MDLDIHQLRGLGTKKLEQTENPNPIGNTHTNSRQAVLAVVLYRRVIDDAEVFRVCPVCQSSKTAGNLFGLVLV